MPSAQSENPEFAAPGRVRGILGGTPPRQKGVCPISRRVCLCDVLLVGRAARFDISLGEHEHERLQENSRRNRRRCHARRHRLHPGFRRILQQLRIWWIWWRVWLQPALLWLQQLFLVQQLFVFPLRPTILPLPLRAPPEGCFVLPL